MAVNKKLRAQYDFVDFAEFEFRGGFTFCLGRFGMPVYQRHMEAWNRKFELTGGRRHTQPTDEQRRGAIQEGIVKHLFQWGKGPDGEEVSREEFGEMLADSLDFYSDVAARCGDEESFLRSRMETIAGNSAQPSEQTSGSAS